MNPEPEDPLMSGDRRMGPAPHTAGREVRAEDVINDVVERVPIP